jgi:hypothetical protein
MLEFIVTVITDPLFAIPSAATGFLFGHWFAQRRNMQIIRITEFNRGAAAFRAAFTDVKLKLRDNSHTGDELFSRIITRDVRVEHEKAKILFEPFLSAEELISFNSQWDKYENCQNDFYQRDETYNNVNPGRKDESQYCLEQLEALLAYAKPKT